MDQKKIQKDLKAAVAVVFERKEGEPLLWWLGAGATRGGGAALSWVLAPDGLKEKAGRAGRIGMGLVLTVAALQQSPGWGLGFLVVALPAAAAWSCAVLPEPEKDEEAATGEADPDDAEEAELVADNSVVEEQIVPTAAERLRFVKGPARPRIVEQPVHYDLFDEANWTPPPQSDKAPF